MSREENNDFENFFKELGIGSSGDNYVESYSKEYSSKGKDIVINMLKAIADRAPQITPLSMGIGYYDQMLQMGIQEQEPGAEKKPAITVEVRYHYNCKAPASISENGPDYCMNYTKNLNPDNPIKFPLFSVDILEVEILELIVDRKAFLQAGCDTPVTRDIMKAAFIAPFCVIPSQDIFDEFIRDNRNG